MPESEATRWERIRWSDSDPVPERGSRVTVAHESHGMTVRESFVVVDSRIDFEPGWIQVEIALEDRDRVAGGIGDQVRDLTERSRDLTNRGSTLRRESDEMLDRNDAERASRGHPSETTRSVDPPDA